MANPKETQPEFTARILSTIPMEEQEQWLHDHLIIPAFWNEQEWEVVKIEKNRPSWEKWLNIG